MRTAFYGVAQKSGWVLPIFLLNIVVGIVGLCYKRTLIHFVTGDSHNTGGVTIFTVRAKLNKWHNFYFLYQSWYMVIYVSMIVWGFVSVASPVKDSKDKDAIEWTKDKMEGKTSAFWVLVNIFGL
jgi:hypothetical protein